MELLTLDSNPSSPNLFQPVRLIENYESLIWTERYSSCGDFELVSSDITSMLKLLPLESYVTLRESTVPMIVESLEIQEPRGKSSSIKIRGRSFESVLERRASVHSLSPTEARAKWIVNSDQFKHSDAAYKAIRQVIGDSSARSNLPALSPAVAGDEIPEVNLPLPTDYTTGTSTPYEIKPGNLYSVVVELLNANHHGIRAVRPIPGKTTVDLEIYNGADLRETAVFDAFHDQFDNAQYLLTHQTSKNVAYIYGPNGASVKLKNTPDAQHPAPTGLKRRVLLIDEMSDNNLNDEAVRNSRGLVELYRNNAVAIFDGEITEVTSKFNKPVSEGGYGLGDIVRFRGNYELNRNMRVVEFIRSSDANGLRAYPAFEVVEDE